MGYSKHYFVYLLFANIVLITHMPRGKLIKKELKSDSYAR